MNVLITGVAGFIGSNFIYYYLKKNKDDRIIGLDKLTYAGNPENLAGLSKKDKERFIFIKGDICDSKLIDEIFSKYNIEGVINFAAESHVDRSIHEPQIFLKTNVLGTEVLLSIAKKYWYKHNKWKKNVKFLQISTDEVYGSLGLKGYFTEKTPLDPHSPYSASKASADLIVKAYHDTYGMPINITRCSNNYGPYQFPEKLIPLMINNALNHKELPVYGDGKQIRDWLFVTDHCEAIDLVFHKAKEGEIYNIGGNTEKENIAIIKEVVLLLQKKTEDIYITDNLIINVPDRLGHDRRYAIDASKIRKELGWSPKIDFKKGIKNTIDWYLKNIEWTKAVISGEYLDFYKKNYTNLKQK